MFVGEELQQRRNVSELDKGLYTYQLLQNNKLQTVGKISIK
jgi:hypothetical protein